VRNIEIVRWSIKLINKLEKDKYYNKCSLPVKNSASTPTLFFLFLVKKPDHYVSLSAFTCSLFS